MPTLSFRSPMPVSAQALYDWHLRAGALQRLLPPWDRSRVLHRPETLQEGAVVVLSTHLGPWPWRWEARHSGFEPGQRFCDEQIRGPFRRWLHTHRFIDQGATSVLEDTLEYECPAGALGSWLCGAAIEKRLTKTFAYRHRTLQRDLERHQRFADRGPRKIAITGASGLIGAPLVAFLQSGGHRVIRLVRRQTQHPDEISWDPARGTIDAAKLEGLDAVIHLAGESINGRWTTARKNRIRDSRVRGTHLLCQAIAHLSSPPPVLLSSSAVGYYGDRGEQPLGDESQPGTGFLSEVCQAWEQATQPAVQAGVRVVHVRTGIVLSLRGGALAKMLPPFRMGLGGPMGTGRQYMSWISLEDMIGLFHHALFVHEVQGPLNATAPEPVTNEQFSRELGIVLHRPVIARVPSGAIRLILGEMGQSLLLQGARVMPVKAQATGYRFVHPTLHDALSEELGAGA